MFSSEAVTTPLRVRALGIIVGSAIMVAVAAALVSAKTLPFMFVIVLLSFVFSAVVRGAWRDALPRPGTTKILLAAFAVYTIISSVWALVPAAAFVTTVLASLVAAASVAMLQLVQGDQRANLLHMGEGLWLGFLVALIYLGVELASGQSIKIVLYNLAGLRQGDLAPPEYFTWADGRLVAILREDLTRNMAPLTLFLWPAVAAFRGTVSRRYALFGEVMLVLGSGVVVMTAWHETSKVAFAAGVIAFFGVRYAPRFAAALASIGWVVACLCVLPAVLLAQRAHLDEAKWLQSSARHRIIIWNATAERVLESPLVGVGARTTYFLGPSLEGAMPDAAELAAESGQNEVLRRTLSTHAHNVFLQTWFELGLVGATLLALFGVALVRTIAALAPAVRPYAFATFISAAFMSASSYSLWQYWFVAMFGLTAVCCRLGIELVAAHESAADSRHPDGVSAVRT